VFDEGDYDGDHFSGLVGDAITVEEIRFDGCQFVKCSFSEARFIDCVFSDCVFTDCSMALWDPVDSRFSGAGFDRCKLTGVDWSGADWSSGALADPFRFSDCALDLSVFMGAILERALFRDCSLREVDFSGAVLRHADFSGSDLGGARFSRADLRGASLVEAHSYMIDTNDNKVEAMKVALPEAVSLFSSIGVELVDRLAPGD
jgi:uncharacterized protein YjbI with pentapeptide repeats